MKLRYKAIVGFGVFYSASSIGADIQENAVGKVLDGSADAMTTEDASPQDSSAPDFPEASDASAPTVQAADGQPSPNQESLPPDEESQNQEAEIDEDREQKGTGGQEPDASAPEEPPSPEIVKEKRLYEANAYFGNVDDHLKPRPFIISTMEF